MASQTLVAEIIPENYRFLQEQVYSAVGIVLESNKHYLFESRLAPIVRQLGLASINDLCAFVKACRRHDVTQQIAESMTTNETYFFREPAQYDAIRNLLLPRLKDERKVSKKLHTLVQRVSPSLAEGIRLMR